MVNWLETRGTVLHGPDYFPPLEITGPLRWPRHPSSAPERKPRFDLPARDRFRAENPADRERLFPSGRTDAKRANRGRASAA